MNLVTYCLFTNNPSLDSTKNITSLVERIAKINNGLLNLEPDITRGLFTKLLRFLQFREGNISKHAERAITEIARHKSHHGSFGLVSWHWWFRVCY